MPLHDFSCPVCSAILQDLYRSIDIGGMGDPPLCPRCGTLMDWVVPVVAMDASPFQPFEISRDVYEKNPDTGDVERFQKREVVDSLHTMRTIEADSERRFRNGEGEPLRFRMLSQNASNKDVGAFGSEGKIGEQSYASGQAPQKKPNIDVRRHGAKKPQVKVAKGAGQSALKGGG